jgi:hypothetical protein
VDLDVSSLTGSGRFGGVVLLTAAAAGFVWMVVYWDDPSLGYGDTVEGFAWVALGSVLALVVGVIALRRGITDAKRQRKSMSGAACREVVRTRELGFHVCAACNTLGEQDWGNGCLRCGSVAEFLPVTDEDERRMAIASIVLE